jgi:hypothetical protein
LQTELGSAQAKLAEISVNKAAADATIVATKDMGLLQREAGKGEGRVQQALEHKQHNEQLVTMARLAMEHSRLEMGGERGAQLASAQVQGKRCCLHSIRMYDRTETCFKLVTVDASVNPGKLNPYCSLLDITISEVRWFLITQ